MVTRSVLDGYLGKPIAKICSRGFASAHENHCAHFVSHALGFHFGFTCADMKAGLGSKASIRVHEVFHQCPSVGKWEEKPVVLIQCLVFITAAGNVDLANRSMDNVPRKHVGILCDGLIWHYSNSHQKVVNQAPEMFKHHYPAPSNSLFYGQIPWVPSL
jgi:hypothetical protein